MAKMLKILILEDNPDDSEMIQRLLKKEKINAVFSVTMTPEGFTEALEQFKPDLVLSDNSMPQFNASEALVILRERSIHLPFILVTGTVSEEFAANIIKQGADDYILKDRLARLPAAINAALSLRKAEREKKEAKEKIIQSEANLRAIFENSTEGFLLLDKNCIIKTFNSKAAEYSFLSREKELETGQPIYNFIEEERKPAFQKIISNVMDGNRVHYERVYELENKETAWLEFSVTPVREDNKVTGICIAGRDITEKKIAEQQREFDSNNLKALINNTNDLMWSVDQDLRLITFNDAFSKVINSLIGAAPAKGDYVLSDKYTQDQLTRYRAFYLRALSGETFNMVDHFDQPYEYWSETSFYPIRKGDEVIGTACFSRDITQRKKDEEKIHKSEEQYRDLVENISDLICTHDLEGRILSVNNAAEELIGHKFNPEEHLNIKDLLAPGKKDMFSQYITELKTNGHAQGLMEVQTFSGKIHIWEYSNSLKTTGGETIVRGYARDITETKKAADKMRFDAELLNTVGQSVIATDINGIVIYWNNAAEKIYGWSAPETIGKNIVDLTPAHQSKEMAGEIMNELKKGNSWSGEFLVTRKDGTVFPAYVTDSPIYNNQGHVIGIIGVSMDISERKKAEKELADYKYALDESAIISMTDDQGIIKYVNEYFCRISKYSKEELLGRDHSMINSGYHSEEFIKNLWQTIEDGRIWKGEFRNKAKDGSFYWVEATIVPFLDAKSKPYQYLAIRYDITQKKKTEEQLKISEEKYRTIFIKSPLPIWIYDTETLQILDINEAAILHYGYTQLEFLSMTIKDIRPKEDLEELLKDIDKINKGMESRYGTWRHLKKNGEIIIVETTAHPIEYAGRKSRMVIANDVTERKRIQEQLVEREEQLELFIEHSPVSLAMFDNEMKYIAASRGWIKDYNLEGKKLIGESHYKVFPGISQEWTDAHRRCLQGAIEKNEDDLLILENGSEQWLRWEIRPWHKASGAIGGIIIFAEIITERKKAEKELLESRTRLNQSQEIAHLGNWEVNFETNTSKWSDEAFRIYGLPQADHGLSIEEWMSFIHPDDMEHVKKEIEKSQATLSDFAFYHRILRKDGTVRYVYAQSKYEFNKHGKPIGLYGIALDVTESKEAEEKILKYTEELKNSNTELERFAYVASHDLQEPLRMVTSFLNLLEEDMAGILTETSKEYMHFVVDGAARMKILINDLLQYSRVGASKEEFTITDLNEVMEYVNFMMKEDIEKNHAIIITHPLPVIKANKTLFNQLFMNLVSNALKYHDGKQSEIEVGYNEEPGRYVFYVKDNGIGIEPEFLDKIFIIFQRLHTKTEYSGTGIGLAICKKIVEIHKGKIWVESEKEKGSTFYFSIPKK